MSRSNDQLVLVPLVPYHSSRCGGGGGGKHSGATAEPPMAAEGGGVPANAGFWGAGIDSEVVLYLQQHGLQQPLEDLRQQMILSLADHKCYMQSMNSNIHHIAIQLVAHPPAHVVLNGDGRHKVAKLSKCPKNLHLLWREYEFGLDGQKAAKNFTPEERGKNKFSYSRRKVFWDAINVVVAK